MHVGQSNESVLRDLLARADRTNEAYRTQVQELKLLLDQHYQRDTISADLLIQKVRSIMDIK